MSRRARLLGPGALAGAIALLLVLPLGLERYGLYLMSLWLVNAIAALGLNLTLGYAGQVSLAQAAFMGIGAYVTALTTPAGVPFFLAFAGAGLLCFVLGFLLGFPALRVRHHYLAFVTLAFNALAWLVFRNEEWLTGGTYGVFGIPRPEAFGLALDGPLRFYLFVLVVAGPLTAAMWWLVHSPWGRAFKALRENPTRAESLGVDIRLYTVLAFALGAAYGGFAGALFAPLVEFVDPSPFALGASLSLLLMVVVGGAGWFWGPFLGAGIAILLPEWLRFAEGLYLLVYASLVIVLLTVAPGGLPGLVALATRGRLRA